VSEETLITLSTNYARQNCSTNGFAFRNFVYNIMCIMFKVLINKTTSFRRGDDQMKITPKSQKVGLYACI